MDDTQLHTIPHAKATQHAAKVGGPLLSPDLMRFLNQGATSPSVIISRHVASQLANRYGEAGGALI